MKVEITEFAECELKRIYNYYRSVASEQVAGKIKNRILEKAMTLTTFPYRGQEEENLKELQEGHRYLVEGNYKIIYKITENTVFITDVFDTRQDPEKMKRTR